MAEGRSKMPVSDDSSVCTLEPIQAANETVRIKTAERCAERSVDSRMQVERRAR